MVHLLGLVGATKPRFCASTRAGAPRSRSLDTTGRSNDVQSCIVDPSLLRQLLLRSVYRSQGVAFLVRLGDPCHR